MALCDPYQRRGPAHVVQIDFQIRVTAAGDGWAVLRIGRIQPVFIFPRRPVSRPGLYQRAELTS